ncbi:polysaccharide export outer membrane protein [Collimonas sp. OK412]|jgi:polysaccharide export outer membrane protein|nr:polysaccharide export outer membrane protein [Collimonas sp. OK412]
MNEVAIMMRRIYACVLLLLLLAFASNSASAADTPIGAGDSLKISVFGNPDLSLETKVGDAGNITFPLIGAVSIGGLSTAEAEKKISDMLTGGGFLRKAEVNVTVTELQSQQVSVLGQVLHPGRYPIAGKRSVTDMLAMAGGVGPEGGDTAVVIRTRNGKSSKQVVNLQDMIQAADMKSNLDLVNGDMIYVDRAPKFYIYGEVQHPGGYRLERNMTIAQALSIGGGLTPRGTERGVRIKRRDSHGNSVMIDANRDEILQTDDVVYVKESLF